MTPRHRLGACRRRGETKVRMLTKPLLSYILDNELLTRGLGDPEARMLVEWLVDQAERIAAAAPSELAGPEQGRILCCRGPAIRPFWGLLTPPRRPGPARPFTGAE